MKNGFRTDSESLNENGLFRQCLCLPREMRSLFLWGQTQIFMKDEFLGAVGACGFLLDDGEVAPFLVNMTTGIDEEDIERLSADIETISTEKARTIVSYIEEDISKIITKFEKKRKRHLIFISMRCL